MELGRISLLLCLHTPSVVYSLNLLPLEHLVTPGPAHTIL